MDYKDKIALNQQLDNFKTNIDLVDFALKHDYKIDKTKDSASWKFLRHSNGDALIFHRNPNGHYFYTNVHNSSDKGTIIDFVQKKILNHNNLGEVRKYIENFSGLGIVSPAKHSLAPTEKKSIENLFEYYKLYKLTNSSYLNSRGITNDTLNSSAFINRIFNRVHLSENGSKFINTVFPIYNESGICGLDQKNKNLNGFLPGSLRANGFWRSNFDASQPIKNLIIVEAPIDALSHYELNPFKSDNNLYLATCGTPSHQQTGMIEKFLVSPDLKPEKICFGFDNDCAGEMFSAQLLGKISNPDFFVDHKFANDFPHLINAQFDCTYNAVDKQGVVGFNFNTKSLEESIGLLKDIEVRFKNFNNECKGITSENSPFEYKYKTLSDASARGEITFPQVKEHWTKINDFIKEIKFNNSQQLNFDKSVNKDFNDDLQVLKGLKTGLPLNDRYSQNYGASQVLITRNCNVEVLPQGDKLSYKILLHSNSTDELNAAKNFINARIKDFNADSPSNSFAVFQKSLDNHQLISLTSKNAESHTGFIKETLHTLQKDLKFDVSINALKDNLSQPSPKMKM